jgi:hypothetical protein
VIATSIRRGAFSSSRCTALWVFAIKPLHAGAAALWPGRCRPQPGKQHDRRVQLESRRHAWWSGLSRRPHPETRANGKPAGRDWPWVPAITGPSWPRQCPPQRLRPPGPPQPHQWLAGLGPGSSMRASGAGPGRAIPPQGRSPAGVRTHAPALARCGGRLRECLVCSAAECRSAQDGE